MGTLGIREGRKRSRMFPHYYPDVTWLDTSSHILSWLDTEKDLKSS